MKELNKRLADIQRNLKSPKGQFNKFANFNYRSCEDILEAVKPLLGDLTLTISDEVVNIGDRYYVKATVRLALESAPSTAPMHKDSAYVEVSAYAREAEDKKGMDDAQITGATSSYARKYALNGLFAIDDTQDADAKDNTVKKTIKEAMAEVPKKTYPTKKPVSNRQETIDVGDSDHPVVVEIPATKSNLKAVCTECNKPVDNAVQSYSLGRYGKVLCRTCQKKAPTK